MVIEELKIKASNNYNWDDIIYINDFDKNSLEIIKENQKLVLIFIILNIVLSDLFILLLIV